MLSVGGSGARSRSKSPGRRDDRERSRSRDIRAPSPARRAPSPAVAPPPASRSQRYYEDDDDDSLASDSESRRRNGGYSRGAETLVRGRYEEDEDEDEEEYDDKRRHGSRYAETEKHKYATEEDLRAKTYRRDDRRREQPRSKEYAIPGQFDEEEDVRPSGREHHQERPNGQGRSASYTMNNSQYEKLPQFQYAAVDPKELRYVSNKPHYTRTPSNEGPVYTRNPGAQVTVASSRHGRQPSYEVRDPREKSDKHSRDDRHSTSRRELERMEKERDELRRQEGLRRQLDQLKREKEEREEAELKQKRTKTVQIRDDREREREHERERDRDRTYREIKPKNDRKYSNDDPQDRRREYEADLRRRDDPRRRYDDEDSDDSDEDERLEKLYHAKYREDDRYDDRYDDRRDDRRREKDDKIRERPEQRRRESEEKSGRHQVVEIHPGGRGALPAPTPGLSERARGLSLSGHKSGALTLAAPGSSSHARRGSVGAPPGSPLLESYRGTYQSISPMPSPMALAHNIDDDSDLSDFDLAVARKKKRRSSEEDSDSSEEERSRKERKPKSILKRAQELGIGTYEPEHDALALARELKGNSPSADVLIKILPTLSNDSISLLRTEYKKHAKIQGKGINIAKHIKLKVGGNNFGKAAYACALGRWESEAHWANFWYQSGSSRRELLIECLFGRSNKEIKAIKEAFTDKRYGDSLTKCMESELKKDKFRVAVLKALEAKRDDSREVNMKLVERDIHDLHKALTSKDGGETAMLTIIVTRGDEHLRTILREYEQVYRTNFAREMVKRSQNLVGETLAHILNGVINRPVRDALLLHQAIAETSKDRGELIVSRLVRLHWEPKHLAKVKIEYANRYKNQLEHDVEDGTKGDFSAFCVGLCHGAVR